MNKKFLVLSILAFVTLLAISAFMFSQFRTMGRFNDGLNQDSQEAEHVVIRSISNDGTAEASTSTDAAGVASVQVTYEYPQFVGLASSGAHLAGKQGINAKLESEAQANYQKNLEELRKTRAALEETHDEPMDFRWQLVNERTVKSDKTYASNSSGVFGYAVGQYVDYAGAHGTFFFDSAAYDLSTGAELKIEDFLQGEYRTALKAYITEQVANPTSTCVRCEYLSGRLDFGLDDLPFDNFSLSADGMTLLFGAYDLGAYASTASGQEIFVPKSVLKDFLKRDW